MNFLKYFLLILIFAIHASAHTGPTINYRVFFKFNGSKVTDIAQSWTFDKTTSEGLLKMYHLKKNTPLSKEKSAKVGEEIIKGVLEYHYFTFIFKNGKDLGKIKPTNLKTKVTKENVSIAFTNHLPTPIDVSKSKLSIQVKDETQGMETTPLEKNPVVLIGMEKKHCNISIQNITSFVKMEDFTMQIPLPPKEISIICNNLK